MLEAARPGAIVLAGIGNEFRSDDGVGLEVCRRVVKQGPKNLRILEITGDCSELLEWWSEADYTIAVDALNACEPAGTIHRLDAATIDSLPVAGQLSSHGLGLAQTVKLGLATHRQPKNLLIYGITGKNFQAGVGLSLEVEEAAERVAKEILETIACTSLH